MDWQFLLPELLTQIFSNLDLEDLMLGSRLVCKSWYQASNDPSLWRNLDLRECYGPNDSLPRLLDIAVARSGGSLQSVLLSPFHLVGVSDMLLLATRCPTLRYLHCSEAQTIQVEAFCEAINELKQLEGIGVNGICLHPLILKQIATSCKNFNHIRLAGVLSIEVAEAIVSWLPNIKFLNLSNSNCKIPDLVVLLKGCRQLEALDITGCGCVGRDPEVQQLALKLKSFLFDREFCSLNHCPECSIYSDEEEW